MRDVYIAYNSSREIGKIEITLLEVIKKYLHIILLLRRTYSAVYAIKNPKIKDYYDVLKCMSLR
jgi:hypothetical protein